MAHSSRRFPVRNQRTVLWAQGPGSVTVTSFSSSTTSVLGLGQTSLGGVTIVRMRGAFEAHLQTVGSAGDGFHCGVGIGIVTGDAFSVGVGSMPNPLADIDWGGWLYHWIFDLHTPTATIGDGVNSAGAHIRFQIDSKAMRKMKPNETIFGSIQTEEDGAASMGVFFDTRMLFKLS